MPESHDPVLNAALCVSLLVSEPIFLLTFTKTLIPPVLDGLVLNPPTTVTPFATYLSFATALYSVDPLW